MNKRIKILVIILCGVCSAAMAQSSIGRAEYWVDSDPGLGRGSAISFVAGAEPEVSFGLNTSALVAGWHTVGVRVAGGGRWSQTYTHHFFKFAIPASAATLSGAEYWVDSDPGLGAATPLAYTAGQTAFNVPVPTNELAVGFHVVGMRVRYGDTWSHTYTHRFFKFDVSASANTLSGAEYWVDSDPGLGAATPVAYAAGQTAFNVPVPTNELAVGFHVVGMRVRYGATWSHTYTHRFFIAEQKEATTLTAAEYWLDEDPGMGNATALSIGAGQEAFSLPLATDALATGYHVVGVRVRYGGTWSHTYTHHFIKPAVVGKMQVEAVEYYWDENDAEAEAIPFTIDGDSVTIENFAISTADLGYGVHYLYLRAKASGVWSILNRYPVCKNATPMFSLDEYEVCANVPFIIYNETENAVAETTFAWDMDGDGNTDITNSDAILTYSYAKAGVYNAVLTVQTGDGCTTSFSREVYVYDATTPQVTLSSSKTTICPDEELTFVAVPKNAGRTPSYVWYRNDAVIEGETSDTLRLDGFSNGDRVKVTVKSANTCASVVESTSNVCTITVSAIPEVSIANIRTKYTDEKVFAFNQGSPAGGTYYVNGTESSYFVPKSNAVGIYTVRYEYANNNGCVASAETTFALKERAEVTVTVETNNAEWGTATGSCTMVEGNDLTITATPNEGCRFVQWNDGNTETTRTIYVDGNVTYSAEFALLDYTIAATANNETFGGVTGGGSYCYGANATLNAVANEGYKFVRWNDGNTDNPRVVAVAHDSVFIAEFALMDYVLTASSNNVAYGIVAGGGNYAHGAQATLTAVPYEGYNFVRWNDGATDNPRIVSITSDSVFTAEFAAKDYTLVALADNADCGSVTGGGTYAYGTAAVLIAVANEGYDFARWSDGNTDNPRIVTVTENANFVAEFDTIYTLTLLANDAQMGNVIGGGKYRKGTRVEIAAQPNDNYTFARWSDGSTLNPRHVLLNDNITLTAYFVDELSGTEPVIGNEVTVIPETNSVIISWEEIATAASYTMTITRDGETICVLTFNSSGLLTNIAFASNQTGAQRAPSAENEMVQGWQYTVTGLESETEYSLTMEAKDADDVVLSSYSCVFTTEGVVPTAVQDVTTESVYVEAGRINCAEPFEVYTITGVNITRQNGNLPSGVYVVKTAQTVTKVIVN